MVKWTVSALRRSVAACGLLCVVILAPSVARAEADRVSVAEQYGIAYLPVTLMRDQHLFEKRLAEANLHPTVSWSVFSGSEQMTDAVLSGSLDFACGAYANFIVLWSKSKGSVRGVTALPATPLDVLTIDPKVQKLTDLSSSDRIAMPTVGVSTQGFMLQYAAAQLYGVANYKHFDNFEVAMAHPDAMNMLLNGKTEVKNDFSAPPFQEIELKNPAVRKISSSYEIMGGPHTSSIVWAPKSFHDANPKTYMAFLLAYRDAVELIQHNPRLAAEAYQRQTKSKEPLDEIEKQVADPEFNYNMAPLLLDKITDFMFDTKRLSVRPNIMQDVFFPELEQVVQK